MIYRSLRLQSLKTSKIQENCLCAGNQGLADVLFKKVSDVFSDFIEKYQPLF